MAGDDRLLLDTRQVQRLVASQFPHWADLEVKPVARGGWDNQTFHLGETMSVRLPSAVRYVPQVQKEHRLLPMLAPALPLPIPTPLAMGQPGPDFPWIWSVYGWLSGETVSAERVPDRIAFARELAQFLRAFWAVDTAGGPPAGVANFHRGGELAVYGAETAACVDALAGRIDADGARRVWAEAIASRWSRPPVWVHGDVAVGNLLVEGGRLSAVIDFGGLAVGDPACDLVIAWLFLDAESRAMFRAELALDDDTWARARGWALWKALLMASQGKLTHPAERAPLDVVALVIAD